MSTTYKPKIIHRGQDFATFINSSAIRGLTPGHYWGAHHSLPNAWEFVILTNGWQIFKPENADIAPTQVYICVRPSLVIPDNFVNDLRATLLSNQAVSTPFGFDTPKMGVVTQSFTSGQQYFIPGVGDFVPIITSDSIEFHTDLTPEEVLLNEWGTHE